MSKLKKYIPFSRGAIQDMLAYRTSLFLWFILDLLYIVIAFFTWRAVYANSGQTVLEGFSFGSMVAYILFRGLVSGTVFMTISDKMVDDFKDGSIAMAVIKPIDYRIQMLFYSMGHNSVFLMMFTLPYIIILFVVSFLLPLGITVSLMTTLYFVLSLFLSFLLNFLIAFIFGIFVYYTFNGFGIWQLKDAITMLFSGAIIPLNFYPDWLYKITQLLPFSSIIYAPISIILNLNTNYNQVIFYQLMWIVILFFVMIVFWKKTQSRMLIQGG